jgi:Domain of unknown function (DUF1874).
VIGVSEITKLVLSSRRVILLNALPVQAFKHTYFTITCKRTSLEAVKDIVLSASVLENYIRHEATIRALNEAFNLSLTPNPGLYEYRDGDVLVIVTLKKPQRGVEAEQLTTSDLDFVLCISETRD